MIIIFRKHIVYPIVQAELFGIFHGLQLAKRKNVAKLEIESDSNSAI